MVVLRVPFAPTSGRGAGSLARRAALLVALVVAGCDCGGGGSSGPPPGGELEIPASHPRLWWNEARLAEARTWFASHPFTPGDVDTAADAIDAAFHTLLTGEESGCRDAIAWALAVRVNTGGNGSDIARWDGEGVILVYDWCHAVMSSGERSELVARWNGYVEALNEQDWGGIGMEGNNYYLGNLRNTLAWAIATYGESDQASEFLTYGLETRWEGSYLPYANEAGKGGIMHEGSAYGRRVLAYFTVPLTSAGLLGRNMWDETPFFRESVYWLVYSTTPGLTQQPGNGGTVEVYETWPMNEDERWGDRYVPYNTAQTTLGDYLTPLIRHWHDLPIAGYAQRFVELTDADPEGRFIAAVAPTDVAPRAFDALPLDYYAAGMGMGYAKTAWEGDATALNVQVSSPVGVGHTHLDEGSFQMWRHGRWVARETVGYAQDIASYAGGPGRDCRETVGHNGLLYDGRGTIDWQDSRPETLRLESTEDYFYIAMDLTGAYTIRADQAHREEEIANGQTLGNPGAGRTIREMIFVRPLETLVIFDRMEASGDAPSEVVKTFLVHFENMPTADGDAYVGVTGDQALRVTTVVPATTTRRIVNEGGDIGQYRAEIETSGAAQSHFLHVLQARDASGADVAITLDEDGDVYTLTLVHPALGTAAVELVRGTLSTGGAFGFATSGTPSTTPLRAGVQTITIDYDGVRWNP